MKMKQIKSNATSNQNASHCSLLEFKFKTEITVITTIIVTMKICPLLIKCAENIGLHLRCDERSKFNGRNVGILIIFGLNFISATAFFWYDASTFKEYTMCFFAYITLLALNIGFLATIIRSPQIFQLLNDTEHFIENRTNIKVLPSK